VPFSVGFSPILKRIADAQSAYQARDGRRLPLNGDRGLAIIASDETWPGLWRVRLLQGQGIVAEKIFGMCKPGADLPVPLPADRAVEVKCCAVGFRQRYDWLKVRDVLIVKADRKEPLVVVRISLAAEIAKAAV
jgi:hypothetical protein